MLENIDYRYVVEKFLRDTAMFFLATDVVRQVADGSVGLPSWHSVGIALVGAAGTAGYRLIREFGLFPKEAA